MQNNHEKYHPFIRRAIALQNVTYFGDGKLRNTGPQLIRDYQAKEPTSYRVEENYGSD